jgi:hypothetical protein
MSEFLILCGPLQVATSQEEISHVPWGVNMVKISLPFQVSCKPCKRGAERYIGIAGQFDFCSFQGTEPIFITIEYQ